MLKQDTVSSLQNTHNLLAFSAGVDSSALFFLLLENNIPFDIAIVNYNLREESKDEVAYAEVLAKKYKLQCHIYNAPKIEKNFEANARVLRYEFFETLVQEYNYENVMTAHHLGDRFEWMLMQFCKGAGCAELLGMQERQNRDKYTLVRPLLHLDKQELLEYLHKNHLDYFEDKSNLDEKMKRNEFRHNYSKPLLEKYLSGIKKSFAYLDEDRDILIQDIKVTTIDDFAYFESLNQRSDIFAIDKHIKSCGHIIKASERELLKTQITTVLGRKYIVTKMQGFVFIAPYVKAKVRLESKLKDEYRKLKIEPKLRVYFAQNKEVYIVVKRIILSVV